MGIICHNLLVHFLSCAVRTPIIETHAFTKSDLKMFYGKIYMFGSPFSKFKVKSTKKYVLRNKIDKSKKGFELLFVYRCCQVPKIINF